MTFNLNDYSDRVQGRENSSVSDGFVAGALIVLGLVMIAMVSC